MARRQTALASSLGASTAAALLLALALAADSPTTRRYVVIQHLGSLLFALGFTPVGSLLTLRRPANRISWLVAVIGAVAAFTLAADATALYLVQDFYDQSRDRTLRWNDPAVGVAWPAGEQVHLSAKDAAAPRLSEIDRAELLAF